MIDFLLFHDLSQEHASIYFQCDHFFIIEWLFISPLPPLAGEKYGKMEPKYSEGGHCQSVLHTQGINSVEMVAPFNVLSHPRNTMLLACYLERIAQILWVRVKQTALVNS